ncbi:MAG: YaaR family protein [Clostridia bacterium]|nr:YaaR family protein [Clostridia bacterium]
MKVQESFNKPSNITNVVGKDDRKISDSRETGFQNHLKQVEERSLDERLHELVSKITEQGEKLSKKIDIRELKIYKKMISEFLDEALGNSQKFSKQSILDRRGRHKVYALIKKINTELDNLTKDVLSEEKDNIKILQRLDDIRGLILDITM